MAQKTYCGFQGRRKKKKFKMKIFFCLFFLLTIITLQGTTKSLGYCPKDTVQECRTSLASAMNVVTNCPLNRPRTKKCAKSLVQTLSEADNTAPFYADLYEDDFLVGDAENYKKEVRSLKDYSPHAYLVLHNLSKAIILYYTDVNNINSDQKRILENLLEPVFEREEKRPFDVTSSSHNQEFIKRVISQARNIEWGAPKEKTVIS